jgi:hypothetical protein
MKEITPSNHQLNEGIDHTSAYFALIEAFVSLRAVKATERNKKCLTRKTDTNRK